MSFDRRDRILGAYAPLGLMATLAAWLALVLAGFTLIFWGNRKRRLANGVRAVRILALHARLRTSEHLGVLALDFLEAAIGLFLLALLITYLPSIYSAYSRREVGITALEVRAGSPPSAREMILAVLALWSACPRSARSGWSGSAGSSRSRRPTRPIRRSSSSVPRTPSIPG